jgi:hypothetical protein
MATIKIGGAERLIAPFSAAKAMEAAGLVSEIVEAGNGILAAMDDYAAKHAERSTIKVPRAAAFYRNPEAAAAVPNDAWEASGNVLEVPGPRPGFEEQLLAVFPQVWRVARDQVLKLLALVLVGDSELEQADSDGGQDGIDKLLATEGRALLHKAQMQELVALGQTAWEVCRDQLQADPTALAMVNRLMSLRTSGQQKTATASGPGSSTASRGRTGGRAKKSSGASRGESSKPSTVSS